MQKGSSALHKSYGKTNSAGQSRALRIFNLSRILMSIQSVKWVQLGLSIAISHGDNKLHKSYNCSSKKWHAVSGPFVLLFFLCLSGSVEGA